MSRKSHLFKRSRNWGVDRPLPCSKHEPYVDEDGDVVCKNCRLVIEVGPLGIASRGIPIGVPFLRDRIKVKQHQIDERDQDNEMAI